MVAALSIIESCVVSSSHLVLSQIWAISCKDRERECKLVTASHCQSVQGLAVHPTREDIYATAGEDAILAIWCTNKSAPLATTQLIRPGRSVAFSHDGRCVHLCMDCKTCTWTQMNVQHSPRELLTVYLLSCLNLVRIILVA